MNEFITFHVMTRDAVWITCIYSEISNTWYITWGEVFTGLKIFVDTTVVCTFGTPVNVDENRYTDISTIREI